MEISEYYKKIAELRKGTTVEHINALITINVIGLVGVMVLFGYLWKVAWLLKLFFVIGLLLLMVLIVARQTWYGDSPKAMVHEKEKQKVEEKEEQEEPEDMFDLGLPSAEEYNKKTNDIFK